MLSEAKHLWFFRHATAPEIDLRFFPAIVGSECRRATIAYGQSKDATAAR
jgi:hypothetical protein